MNPPTADTGAEAKLNVIDVPKALMNANPFRPSMPDGSVQLPLLPSAYGPPPKPGLSPIAVKTTSSPTNPPTWVGPYVNVYAPVSNWLKSIVVGVAPKSIRLVTSAACASLDTADSTSKAVRANNAWFVRNQFRPITCQPANVRWSSEHSRDLQPAASVLSVTLRRIDHRLCGSDRPAPVPPSSLWSLAQHATGPALSDRRSSPQWLLVFLGGRRLSW